MDLLRCRVLLVDDDEDDYFITADLLSEIEDTHFDLEWVSTYAEGLESIMGRAHDVYLLDYRLGDRTGLELLREAIAGGCREPIILLTGQGDREIDIEAMSAGAADYLVKGQINAPLLERAIRYSLKANQNEKKLAHMAEFDTLTGLPNRSLFQDRLRQTLALARRQKHLAALMFLDLDRFKLVNDTLGHSAGDELLKVIAERLRASVRDSDTVARLGGDEFVVILADIQMPPNLAMIAQRIIDDIKRPVQFENQEIFPGTSIGIAMFPHDGTDAETLIKKADMAMYQAKAGGGKNYAFSSEALSSEALERLTLEGKLHRALEKGEFTLNYQPQFALTSGELVGGEALLRWRSGDRTIGPDKFIPLLEEIGLIVPVGAWVLEAACQQGISWQEAGRGSLNIAVNLSRRQLLEPNFAEMVDRTLRQTGLPPECLELELTESMVIENVQQTRDCLNALKRMGVSLAMDDFGTGYSSLNCIKLFPFDRIKIDRSFIANIGKSAGDEAILRGIVPIIHNLGMSVVAEGVEEQSQMDFLADCGCDLVQGYFLGRPMPAENFTEFFGCRQKSTK